jgi:hypothetical protein
MVSADCMDEIQHWVGSGVRCPQSSAMGSDWLLA